MQKLAISQCIRQLFKLCSERTNVCEANPLALAYSSRLLALRKPQPTSIWTLGGTTVLPDSDRSRGVIHYHLQVPEVSIPFCYW